MCFDEIVVHRKYSYHTPTQYIYIPMKWEKGWAGTVVSELELVTQ